MDKGGIWRTKKKIQIQAPRWTDILNKQRLTSNEIDKFKCPVENKLVSNQMFSQIYCCS